MRGTLNRPAVAATLVLAVMLGVSGCREEGPAEKTGKRVDEMVDKLRHGNEGKLEKAGRELGEAVDDAVREAGKALE